MRQVVGWLQLVAAVALFTAFLTYIAVTYAVVAAYESLNWRQK